MRFIHTSDWHIGQRFYSYEREDEHAYFFSQLTSIVREHQPDALIVSGDIFDTPAPSASSQKMLTDAVIGLLDAAPDMRIVIIAGNHDSASRLEASKSLWQRAGVTIIGGCSRLEEGGYDARQFIIELPGKGIIVAAPFIHTSAYPAIDTSTPREDRPAEFFANLQEAALARCSGEQPIVLMAHLALTGCDFRGHEERLIGTLDQFSTGLLGDTYDYIALGHIHRPQYVGNKGVRYSGSPIPLSFTEDYPHSVSLVEITGRGAEPAITTIPIDALRRTTTIPSEAGADDIETALKLLGEIPDDEQAYIRVFVKSDRPLQPDAEQRALAAIRGKSCRFCEIRPVIERASFGESSVSSITDVDDLLKTHPFEIANRYYTAKVGSPLPEDLAAMLHSVIDDVKADLSL